MEIFANVVGTHFRGRDAKYAVNALLVGDEIRLEAEPHNEYDPHAVACWFGDTHIGYLSRHNNTEISRALIDTGIHMTGTVATRDGNQPVLLVRL